jgi:hypothetical protein
MLYKTSIILLLLTFSNFISYSQISNKVFNDSILDKTKSDTTSNITQSNEGFYEVAYSNVSKGDRIITKKYLFESNLPKAYIQSKIKVSPEGKGIVLDFDKGSTSRDSNYLKILKLNLPHIVFNKSDHESIITVPFFFKGL